MVRALSAIMLVVATVAALQAQAPAPPAAAPAPQAPSAAPSPTAPGQPPAAVAPPSQGFTYNPEGRRDPFLSLIRRGGDSQRSGVGARPAGLGGLSISEVSIRGTIASRTGYVAMLAGADNRTYIVRAGDKLFDGMVREITQDAVVLVQQVNDPLSLEKQREVRKVLRQTEEAK